MDPSTPIQPYIPPASPQPAVPAADVPQAYPSAPQPAFGGVAPQPIPGANLGVPPIAPIGNSFSPPPVAMPPSNSIQPAPMDFGATPPTPAAGPSTPKTEIIERLKQANNVLVTVSSNPSVDQLSSAIALTLLLNKLDKHATAVFSGNVPSTLEFLQPEKTIEKNTNSLRDFIIALDKSKADKLRYKVEDKFVKIFITPYHTSLSEDDLEFSQGDFNVDVVVALGVHKHEELDEAITAHGRILHDAVVACVNNKQTAELGAINWFEPTASSLAEMLVGLIEPLQGQKALLDEQMATAFLTGVVAETERFSNDKTTPHTMNISATLMKAGANQQLVASKLQEPAAIPQTPTNVDKDSASPAKAADGSLAIEHKKEAAAPAESKTLADLEKANSSSSSSESDEEGEESGLDKIHIDSSGQLQRIAEIEEKKAEDAEAAKAAAQPASTTPPVTTSNMILQPPTLGGALSANTVPESSPAPLDPLNSSSASDASGMQHGKSIQPLSEEEKSQTLSQLEQAVESPHLKEEAEQESAAEAARAQVNSIQSQITPMKPEPITALNAQPIDLATPQPSEPVAPQPTEQPAAPAFPSQLIGPDPGPPSDPTAGSLNPTAPPPVPPPLIPPDAE